MEAREWLERLEKGDGGTELLTALCFLAWQAFAFDSEELRGAKRRAVLLLAAGGDPTRSLDLEGRAVTALAGELPLQTFEPAFKRSLSDLAGSARGLPTVSTALEALLREPILARRALAAALLAEELGGD